MCRVDSTGPRGVCSSHLLAVAGVLSTPVGCSQGTFWSKDPCLISSRSLGHGWNEPLGRNWKDDAAL